MHSFLVLVSAYLNGRKQNKACIPCVDQKDAENVAEAMRLSNAINAHIHRTIDVCVRVYMGRTTGNLIIPMDVFNDVVTSLCDVRVEIDCDKPSAPTHKKLKSSTFKTLGDVVARIPDGDDEFVAD